MGLVLNVSWLFCMIWGCISISRGNLTYGSLAAIIQLIGRIQGPIANAVELAARAYGVISSAERLQELTDLPAEEEGENLPDFDSICIENTYFHYPDSNENVLNNINCTIRRGDFVALTGISGGGKTSLFQLLLGIYHPTKGSVYFQSGDKKIYNKEKTSLYKPVDLIIVKNVLIIIFFLIMENVSFLAQIIIVLTVIYLTGKNIVKNVEVIIQLMV